MARITVDLEHLLAVLLGEGPASAIPSVDVDSITEVPLLLFSGFNGHMIRNGFPGAGWEWDIALTLLAPDRTTGGDLADEIYQLVHNMEGRHVDDVGGVSSVEDISMFDRTGTASLPDKEITQYNATFRVRVRK